MVQKSTLTSRGILIEIIESNCSCNIYDKYNGFTTDRRTYHNEVSNMVKSTVGNAYGLYNIASYLTRLANKFSEGHFLYGSPTFNDLKQFFMNSIFTWFHSLIIIKVKRKFFYNIILSSNSILNLNIRICNVKSVSQNILGCVQRTAWRINCCLLVWLWD